MIKIKYNYYGDGILSVCVRARASRTVGHVRVRINTSRAPIRAGWLSRRCSLAVPPVPSRLVALRSVRQYACTIVVRARARAHAFTQIQTHKHTQHRIPGVPRSAVHHPPSMYDVTHYDSGCSSRSLCDTVARLHSVAVFTTYVRPVYPINIILYCSHVTSCRIRFRLWNFFIRFVHMDFSRVIFFNIQRSAFYN